MVSRIKETSCLQNMTRRRRLRFQKAMESFLLQICLFVNTAITVSATDEKGSVFRSPKNSGTFATRKEITMESCRKILQLFNFRVMQIIRPKIPEISGGKSSGAEIPGKKF